MKQRTEKHRYVALLRGINVGGHHKVPMATLKDAFEAMGFKSVKTFLNSGNVVFETDKVCDKGIEVEIATELAAVFGFPIPVLVRKSGAIQKIIEMDPFGEVQVQKDIRLYVTFLKEGPQEKFSLPWTSPDGSFKILEAAEGMICSVLDVSLSKTPDAMKILEKAYGRNITTRNWNTILKLGSHEIS